jgi:NAD(P)H-nitrite reductase large subunit
MIVCSCLGITEGEIRDAMAADRDAMAGSCCGSCLPLVSDIARRLKNDEPRGADSDGAPPPSDGPDLS